MSKTSLQPSDTYAGPDLSLPAPRTPLPSGLDRWRAPVAIAGYTLSWATGMAGLVVLAHGFWAIIGPAAANLISLPMVGVTGLALHLIYRVTTPRDWS
jgi:hypothetical protein